MRKRVVGMIVAAAALAACGADAPQGGAASSTQSVDSGPAPTPALDSVGDGARDQGRRD